MKLITINVILGLNIVLCKQTVTCHQIQIRLAHLITKHTNNDYFEGLFGLFGPSAPLGGIIAWTGTSGFALREALTTRPRGYKNTEGGTKKYKARVDFHRYNHKVSLGKQPLDFFLISISRNKGRKQKLVNTKA